MFNKKGNIIATTGYIMLLFALLYPLNVSSAPSVEITVKQRIITTQKRGIVTLPFTVVNRSNKPLQLSENITLPEGWRVLTSHGVFTLAAGEKTLRLIHLLASSDVPAGQYMIPYQLTSKNNRAIRVAKNIKVIIKSLSKLSVEVSDKPDLVLAGEKYTVKALVTNKGNQTVALTIKVKDPLGYLTTFTPHHLTLKPSQKETISIQSNIPTSLKKSAYHTLKLSLTSPSLSIDKSIKTQIISLVSEGIGLYHSIPTSVTANYTNNGNEGILQTEIIAVGALDEATNHYLDLLYRDTKTNSHSSLGSDSEKHLSYHNKSLGLHLGDRSFTLSGITDDGLYGKGAEIDYHPVNKNWSIRAFSAEQNNQDNDTGNTYQIHGIEVGYRFRKDLELTINTLSKRKTNKNPLKKTLMGVDLHWDQYTQAEVNLSIAKDDNGKAFRLAQNGSFGALNYDLEIQQADTDFDGSIKDIKSENLTGIYAFNEEKNYLRTNVYHSRHNLANDNSKRITDEKRLSLGIGYYFNRLHRDSLLTEIFFHETKDRRKKSDYDHFGQGIRLNYQKSMTEQLRMDLTLEQAIENDRIVKKKSAKNRGSLTLAYTPTDHYYLGFNIESNQTNISKRDSLSYGLNAAIHFNSRQHLSGYWRHNNAATETDSVQLNYNHTFHNGINVGASVSTDALNSSDNNLDYLLRITVPFDTPLYRHKNIGTLKGKVTHKQQPIPHVIVGIAGQYAVTDKEGNYQFKAIREGEYALTANLTKTQLNNHLIENEQQRKTTVVANKSTHHNITLVAGTGIKGQVLGYRLSNRSIMQSNHDEIKPSSGIESLLITLTSTKNREIVHKVLTSEGGFFSINSITAGQWLIQVTDPKKVLNNTRLEESLRTITLKVGEEQDILFKAIPLLQKIKKIGPSRGFSVSGE